MTEHSIEIPTEDVEFEMPENSDESILDAAEKHGLDMPYQCRMGHCGICAMHASGEVSQEDAMMLTPSEEEEGYVLTCVATPRSDLELHPEDTP
ncbi:2Fe-2S iron-sulfur cluster-binding protein [Natrarchaeobius oligotrophus]|uniref:(2Fe-2S)-binding protein n=1 Tax=Natrarchaeobius chitinivorans TaxID=1679083 RepID=A0A3N6PS54_NATCH|nr:2Fe-2S iron-sulfur cluster binding domain-containing protein [Natrarchaeobius chitinivorans]RQH02306.1 (2Fe-2S)-binding protein [Natrarchaeobius chitinivorans]